MLTMADSVTASALPSKGVDALAGYVNGRYRNFTEVAALATKRGMRSLSISVFASGDAQCLDVERGDASPAEAPAWVRRQIKRGVTRPVLYASIASAMPEVVAELKKAGIPLSSVRLWSAHYSGHPHVCGPGSGCGYEHIRCDGTQFTDHGPHGENIDLSALRDDFFSVAPHRRRRRIPGWVREENRFLRHPLRWVRGRWRTS